MRMIRELTWLILQDAATRVEKEAGQVLIHPAVRTQRQPGYEAGCGGYEARGDLGGQANMPRAAIGEGLSDGLIHDAESFRACSAAADGKKSSASRSRLLSRAWRSNL